MQNDQSALGARALFHGTGRGGEKFYNTSGWREKAEAEGFVEEFPFAPSSCLHDDLNGDGDVTDPNGEQSNRSRRPVRVLDSLDSSRVGEGYPGVRSMPQ